jgi:ATP-dependent RNA helicase DbpA (EC 5.99.1.-)
VSKSAFSSLSISPVQVKNLNSLGYKNMTPIQAESLPHVLKGKDIIAQAKTGSGKNRRFWRWLVG